MIASFTGLYPDIRIQKRRSHSFGQLQAYGAFVRFRFAFNDRNPFL